MSDQPQIEAFGIAAVTIDGASTQDLVMRLDIYEEAVLRTTYRGNKAVACDELSPFDLARAFAGLPVGTGLLPRDCLFCGKSNAEYRVGIYLPPVTRSLHVEGEPAPFTIPLPALVFVGATIGYSIFALATPEWPDARTPLFYAPFPNVHRAGNICAGTVQFPPVRPDTIHAAARLFFESQFNHDLNDGTSRKHKKAVTETWRELAIRATLEPDWAEYPVDDLVETGQALGDLVEEG